MSENEVLAVWVTALNDDSERRDGYGFAQLGEHE